MTDNKLKRLSRADLIDIAFEQQKRLEESEKRAAELQAMLDERELRLSQAGSIAEAALKLNRVFEAAQAAADQYVASIKAASSDRERTILEAERQRQSMLSDARRQADEIIRQAKAEADGIISRAEEQASEKWKTFERQANELIDGHDDLRVIFGGGYEL